MKHLCGCFESQSFSWSVIQSVLNHFNFLISDRGHGSFFWDVLPQQSIEVFIAASLPACKWSSKPHRLGALVAFEDELRLLLPA